MQWKASFEQKYSSVPGNNNMHNIVIAYSCRKPLIKHKHTCFDGEYEQFSSSSYDVDMTLPVSASHSLKNHSSLFKKERREIVDIVHTKAVMDMEMSMLIGPGTIQFTAL